MMEKLPDTFRTIIAEEPYDAMGAEFQQIFGTWIDQTTTQKDRFTPQHFPLLAHDLFKQRLKLATKYNTFFSRQVVSGSRELWRERLTGTVDGHCYSFAIRDLPRTKRFFAWCQLLQEQPNQTRTWDHAIKALPELPLAPHIIEEPMPVWAHEHRPQFRARHAGAFFVRRIKLGPDVHLIEHPDNRWVPNLRMEAQEYWTRANDPKRHIEDRTRDLAAFEWLWFWTNPFGRAGALTGDALSLVTQQQMVRDGHPIHIRPSYYHQDCEAFLTRWTRYLNKRQEDLLYGFRPRFSMEAPHQLITITC